MSVEDRLESETWARSAERQLRAQVEAQSAELRELKKLMSFYDSARTTPISGSDWVMGTNAPADHRGLVVAQVTDWHLDEVVKPEEIFDLNAFNREIALKRIADWTSKVITLPREYVAGLTIDGLVIPATGDLFTGEIHAELKESNEARLLASVLYWMEHVIKALRLLEKEYPAVAVYAVVGNHGRLAEKSVFKGRVHDNVEWLFWSVLRDRLKDLGSTIEVHVSPSMDMNVPIYGRNHLLTHGDQFRGGTGISGAYAPLSLGAHRKNRRQMRAGMPMETMVIGHMHQLINIPGVIMGGCLKGYDEYAFGLNLDPDPNGAGQAMWITSPERAQVLWMPVYVTDRKAEGW